MQRVPAGLPFFGPPAHTSGARARHLRCFFRRFGSHWHSRVRVGVRVGMRSDEDVTGPVSTPVKGGVKGEVGRARGGELVVVVGGANGEAGIGAPGVSVCDPGVLRERTVQALRGKGRDRTGWNTSGAPMPIVLGCGGVCETGAG